MASDWFLIANRQYDASRHPPAEDEDAINERRSNLSSSSATSASSALQIDTVVPRLSVLQSYQSTSDWYQSELYPSQVVCQSNPLQPNFTATMSPEEARRSQKPYRYGMILLCFGALINWVGLAENYTEPIRYAGVACIVCGALLICTAMCCWLHTPPRRLPGDPGADDDDSVHVITVSEQLRTEKPPEYESCVIQPPSYADAIQLSPAALLGPTVKGSDDSVPQSESTSTSQAAQTSNSNNASCSITMPVVHSSPATVVNLHPMGTTNRVTPLMATINLCHVTCVPSLPPAPPPPPSPFAAVR